MRRNLGVGLYQLAVGAAATLIALWFSLGGHFAEVLFRNWLRVRIGERPAMRAVARLAFWFAAGLVLSMGALGNNGNPCAGPAPPPNCKLDTPSYNHINPGNHYGDHIPGWINGEVFEYRVSRDAVAADTETLAEYTSDRP